MSANILEIKNLSAGYETKQGKVLAVNDINLNLEKGEFLGIAGESGCGKSTLAYSIMNLLEDNGKIFAGQINFLGNNLLDLTVREINKLRWTKMSMVFQSAMNGLNPVLKISEQLTDVLLKQKNYNTAQARKRAEEMLSLVDIPLDRLEAYPHQLSGGMKQRVMIAMAMLLNPELIIMDEPTTALDVVVQRTIIEKIADLQEKFNFSVIFITHDLSLLIEISDNLAIMYGGRIVEQGPAEKIYQNSLHPYTAALMNSFPPLFGDLEDFAGIPGKPPDLLNPPAGCGFYQRCSKRKAICQKQLPALQAIEKGHFVSCYLYE